MSRRKINFKPWGDDDNPGKDVAKAAWMGTKAFCVAVIAGLAIGLGLGAYNSVSAG